MGSPARVWLLVAVGGTASGALSAQTRATLYPDGRVFVRRVIEIPLVRGSNLVALPLETVTPASVIALDSGVTIVSARTPYPTVGSFNSDPTPLLRRIIGREVVILYPTIKDTIRATVLSSDPPRLRLPNGSVAVAAMGMIMFPPELFDAERLTMATIQSRDARPRFEIGYMLTGTPWQAQYTLVVGDRATGRFSGSAVFQTDAIALDSAEISVVEGTVAKVAAAFPMRTAEERMRMGQFQGQPPPPVVPTDSIRIHRIPGRHALRRSEIVNLPLVAEGTVEVARVYRIPGMFAVESRAIQGQEQTLVQPIPQPIPGAGGTVAVSASLSYRVTGDVRSPLAAPLPSGTARIFGPAGGGGLVLLAEARVLEPSPGRLLDLVAGPTTDVAASRTTSPASVEQDTVVTESGSRTVRATAAMYDETIRLRNRTGSAVTVEIVEQRSDSLTVVSSSVMAERLAPGTVRFTVSLPPRGEVLFRARLRVPVS
ncbi:MAG TPA: hypothetical protein VIQ98_01610 [Gemmatimonadales bacterium]